MEVSGANPFLMMGADDNTMITSPSQSNLNPFLMEDVGMFGDASTNIDNPFFSTPATTAPQENAMSNPFAFDPMDDYESSVEPAATTTATTMDFFGDDQSQSSIFNTTATTTTMQNDFMQDDAIDFVNVHDDVTTSTTAAITKPIPSTIIKPNELNLQNKTTSNDNNRRVPPGVPPPPRPAPPARPPVPPPLASAAINVPVSKDTKDLILSVTGTMDTQTSHLLDCIPRTRTPSPISMRDLHSPSPVPGDAASLLLNTTDDLVDVHGSTGDLSSASVVNDMEVDVNIVETQKQQQEFNIFDMENDDFNINTAPMTTTAPIAPITQNMSSATTTTNQSLFDDNDDFMTTPTTTATPTATATAATATAACDINQNQTQKNGSKPPQPQRPLPPRPVPPKPPLPKVLPPSSNINNNNAQQPPRPAPPKPPLPAALANQQAIKSPIKEAFSAPTPEILNEANILETTSAIATEQQDNSNTNPFSFQDDTKFVDTLSNTQAAITTIGDDFMLASSVAPAATTITTTASSQLIDNIFEASAKVEPPVAGGDGDAFNDLFDQPLQTTTTTTGGFNDLFGGAPMNEPLEITPSAAVPKQSILEKFQRQSEEFDAFAAKFESAKDNITTAGGTVGGGDSFDPFGGSGVGITLSTSNNNDAWGGNTNATDTTGDDKGGFGADDEPFDAFLSLSEPPPPPQCTPARLTKLDSDSDDDKDFAVFIKPKNLDLSDNVGAQVNLGGFVPTLAPPPKSPVQSSTMSDTSPRFNPFDQQQEFATPSLPEPEGMLPQDIGIESAHLERTDSQETPPTPLFDDDTSQPLEEFPRIHYKGEGWEMQLRQPNKKKITGQRFWKKIFLKLVYQGDNPVLQLYNAQTDKDPFQELPLQACYSVSEIGAQQYDQFGKIFTVKLQYVFYKERPGVRPGQVTKAERITNKLSQFAAYAIQGDYQGVKEFGSDLKKLGLPVEHAPQISQLFKIGSQNYEHMKEFSMTVEEALFRLTVHRDRALHYKMEEVQITAVDELYVEQNADGGVDKQIARVRLFFLGFLSGMPDIELGVNDMRRQGKEVVGRHDIIPVVTEEWIRLENFEFHACVQQEEYHKTHIIRFKPPDACYIELMRFRIRPPKNRELPLQLKAVMCVTGNKVELRADVLVPGFASRKLGQVPCEDVMIRFPIPECWIYLFRVEKHFRYGSVKSAHRRTGKIKGIERFLGTVETLQESLIEVTSGQAKYEHQHRSIVWRCPRLPKEGQGAYTTHNLVCRMALTSYDQIPEQLSEYAYVEFTMPATQVSHTTVRSVSVQGSDSDEPPEKYVRYLARHEYRVGIEHTKGEGPNAYAAATIVRPVAPAEPPSPVPPTVAESSESDSD